ncbi:MAG: Fe-S cluster assembly sulfur transfer protein SufU [Cellulomonadaceae bacterium]
MEQLYQQVILDHARTPVGRGLVDAADGVTSGLSHQVNPTCGDEVTLRVEVTPDGSAISRISWDGQGCSISQASLSVMAELADGATPADAEHLGETFRELMHSRGKGLDDDREDELGDATAFTGVSQYPARIKCALLGWAALRDALAQAVSNRSADSTVPQESA